MRSNISGTPEPLCAPRFISAAAVVRGPLHRFQIPVLLSANNQVLSLAVLRCKTLRSACHTLKRLARIASCRPVMYGAHAARHSTRFMIKSCVCRSESILNQFVPVVVSEEVSKYCHPILLTRKFDCGCFVSVFQSGLLLYVTDQSIYLYR